MRVEEHSSTELPARNQMATLRAREKRTYSRRPWDRGHDFVPDTAALQICGSGSSGLLDRRGVGIGLFGFSVLGIEGAHPEAVIKQSFASESVGMSKLGLVPKAGLEPARLAPHAPQTCVSAIPPLRHNA